jgi:CBS domain-containing protein
MTPFMQHLIDRPSFTVEVSTSLGDIIDVLSRYNIGAVVVCDNNQVVVGIISERDIVRQLSGSKNISVLLASDIMTHDVISVSPAAKSSDLMRVMTENKCRHLPILEKGKLLGIVSIGDVVKRLLEKYELEVMQMRSFINS